MHATNIDSHTPIVNVPHVEALALDRTYAAWRSAERRSNPLFGEPTKDAARRWQAYRSARSVYCGILQSDLEEYREAAEAAWDSVRAFRHPNRRARQSYLRRMRDEAQAHFVELSDSDTATGREVVEAHYALERAKFDYQLAMRPTHDAPRPRAQRFGRFKDSDYYKKNVLPALSGPLDIQ